MVIYKLGNLLHFISISLAIGLAYIALDRFRYTNRIKAILTAAIKEIKALDANHAKEDTSITQLRRKLDEVSKSKVFGVGDNTGYDIKAICICIVLEYMALVVGSLCPEEILPLAYWAVFIVCVFGAMLPIAFIYYGTRIIKNNDSLINELFVCYSAATNNGAGLSIAALKDNLGIQ